MLIYPNEKRLVKFGDFYLTNVGYEKACEFVHLHDTALTLVHKKDMNYDWTPFITIKHVLFDKVQDRSDMHNDINFNKTMQKLYYLVEGIAGGVHGNKILIHCLAGISRSSAITLWIMAHINKDMKAQELFDFLLSEINYLANPNESMLSWIAFYDDRVSSLKELTQIKRRE